MIAGHRAVVLLNDVVRAPTRTPQAASNRFLSVYFAGKEIPEGLEEQALKIAESMASDGTVSDSVSAHVAHLHWNVNYR